MKIHKVNNSYGYDFYWEGICEHCSAINEKMPPGYDDTNYHKNVIPKMICKSCGKNRDGLLKGG